VSPATTRAAVTGLGVAGLVAGSFLEWYTGLGSFSENGTDEAWSGFWNFSEHGHGGGFFTSAALVLVALAALALLGLALSRVWLIRAVGLVATALAVLLVVNLMTWVGAAVGPWVVLAGALLILAGSFVGREPASA
jgi:hypothetical protein